MPKPLSKEFLLQRGKCCGNGCWNCPYGWENAEIKIKEKIVSQKQNHKRWRKAFNEECLRRDNNKCVFCDETSNLDVHHITDRHDMPNGGYVISNGITVCHEHHMKCEAHHMGVEVESGFMPEELYEKIGSCYEQAVKDSEKLT